MPEFGTSGLRGLAAEFTAPLVAGYLRAFRAAVPQAAVLLIGRDLRASSPRIRDMVAAAAPACGLRPVDCGILPTPALALAAADRGAAAVMVTGSHIPADRNGLKFYTPAGEITKADEALIAAAYRPAPVPPAPAAAPGTDDGALAAYGRRYRDFFAPGALGGLRIGVYQHSSVARDLMPGMVAALGAEAVCLGRSEDFVPVDTEAVDAATRERLADWAGVHRLDAVISTDGDADRPMLADAGGRIVPGDILGPLTARFLGAEAVVTPVSSNTAVERMAAFARVDRCRIGSPHVIAAMQARIAAGPARVAGYEANGGFLLGFEAVRGDRRIAPLMTRDFALPLLAVLALAAAAPDGLRGLLAGLPPRFTATGRLQDIPREVSARIVAGLAGGGAFGPFGAPVAVDRTDGTRLSYADGTILHVRPSGNAPELRCYVEADGAEAAARLLSRALGLLAEAAGPG